MEKYFVFVQTVKNNDCIYVTDLPQGTTSDSSDNVFNDPVEKASFQDQKIIKILSLNSPFYIFVLTKREDGNYFLYLLNERFEQTKINISKSLTDSKSPADYKIIDFAVCEKLQDNKCIPIVFIVKYLFQINTNQFERQPHIAYAAFFRSLNEDEVMISNSLSPFSYNNKLRKPIFFVPNSFKEYTESQENPSSKPQKKSSSYDERPTLIQFSPPYFIYFRNRMFNIIIMKKDSYQSLTLNDQPLRTAYCQFLHQEAALFVFNEVISIIDFSKQLNLPVHIFPYGKLKSDSKFFFKDNILYIYSQKSIYKVPILSTQISDFSNIFTIPLENSDKNPNEYSDKNPTCFTIACNNFILRYGNEFRVAKPKNAGTFAAALLIQNGNVFDCISSLDSQYTTEARKQAYIDCFCELWAKDHREEALMIACNPHFNIRYLNNVISLFEIFNEPDKKDVFSNLSIISATLVKKEDYLEIYKRLKFYLDQCRQRFKEKGTSFEELHEANSYVIMYLSFFHQQEELINFLKTEKINKDSDKTIKKAEGFYKKFKKECNLDIEESLFYAGIGDNKKALACFKELTEKNNNEIDMLDEPDKYRFSPRMEAIKILKKEKPGSALFHDCKWILDSNSSRDFEPYVGIYYYLPSEEDYGAEVIDEQFVEQLRNFRFENTQFNFEDWKCKFFIEWLRCKGLKPYLRLKYAEELFKELKVIQSQIKNGIPTAQKHLNNLENKRKILWIDSIQKYYRKKMSRDSNSLNSKRGDLNPTSALEEAIKEIQEMIREVINIMKKDERQFNLFKEKPSVQALIDMQDVDFKKDLKWLIEDYKAAIEIESEGTTSEMQIIKKCKQATDPAKAFESFDEGRKDLLGKKTTNDKYEWKEKIEYIGLAEFIQKLPDSTTLSTAAPFLSSAISLMTSRIHNLEQRISIQRQVLAEEKMIAAYNQIFKKVESQSQNLNPD